MDSCDEGAPLIGTSADNVSVQVITSLPLGSTGVTSSRSRRSLCGRLPLSPWPVIIVSVLYFFPCIMNATILEAMLYNKLCYHYFHNLTLCSNRSFTASHPDLQVCRQHRNVPLLVH